MLFIKYLSSNPTLYFKFLFIVYDRMASNLAKLIVEQFIDIVQKTSERCCIVWNECAIKIVSRQYIDTLVIEVYYNDKNHCHDSLAHSIPLPLVVIDFTDIKKNCLKSEKWIKYLELKAIEFLNKIEASKGNLLHNICCPPKHKCVPVNKCNCVYREEFTLCPQKHHCKDKPYDDWGKPCKKDKIKCPCYTKPKCPIDIDCYQKPKCDRCEEKCKCHEDFDELHACLKSIYEKKCKCHDEQHNKHTHCESYCDDFDELHDCLISIYRKKCKHHEHRDKCKHYDKHHEDFDELHNCIKSLYNKKCKRDDKCHNKCHKDFDELHDCIKSIYEKNANTMIIINR